jgi:xylulokinase
VARFLGIDVGTTGVRAAILDGAGTRLADAAQACPHERPAPGYAEADAERWWMTTCAVLAQVGAQSPLGAVDAIAVTGQAPTAVLVDGEGRPLRPAILWLDVRAAAEARAIDEALGPGGARAIGGNRMHPYFLGPKLAWLHDHEPDALDRAAFVLQSHAFLTMRLTGEARCDPSTAMLCAPLFDARAGGWSAAGAAAAKVPLRLLPRLARAHDVIGSVTRDAALATGLREGTAVVAGGGDFAASALGAGVVAQGRAAAMLGTAGNLLLPCDEPRFDDRLVNTRHVGADVWLSLGGTLCGAALEWFRRSCAPDASWEALEQSAAGVPPGASGVLALPYFQGERTPVWDERARGIFFGVDLTHHRGHLYRALVEGIALGFRDCLEVAVQNGVALDEVTAVDGGARSALVRQTLCDALGVPLVWPGDEAGGTIVGAAILAGLGAGALDSPGVAARWLGERGRPVVRHAPDPRAHAVLSATFERRRALYAAVRELFEARG